jgi:hypothetical protein
MQEFPGNSEKAKRGPTGPSGPAPDDRPKIEQVTSANAERKKPGLGRKLKTTFVHGSMRDTGDYMVTDVIVPAVRDMLFDAFESGLQRLIYGDSTRTRRTAAPSAYSNVGRVNYSSQYKSPNISQQPMGARMLSNRSRTMHDFGEIIIDSRRDADEVIEQMYEILSRFGVVHVADLYALTGIQSSHVDHKWGWTGLQGTKAIRKGDGRFLLALPEPELVA